jgi:hypothetical protein
MAKLEDIEGIGPKYAATLRKAGVRSTNDLLKKGANPEGRKTISKESGSRRSSSSSGESLRPLFGSRGSGPSTPTSSRRRA